VVAAVGPEAQADPRGFDRAVRRAVERLAKVVTLTASKRTGPRVAALI